MNQVIATIGYEGSAIDTFVAALNHASIDVLIDVRDLPLSRKKGFSKGQLSAILKSKGIEYVHLRGLGDPKAGREAARAGDYSKFQMIFGVHMQSEAAQRDMEIAEGLVCSGRACLMCYEADFAKCHRTIVAGHLSRRTGLTIMPMVVQNVLGGIAA